jgi:hypothetical protein
MNSYMSVNYECVDGLKLCALYLNLKFEDSRERCLI